MILRTFNPLEAEGVQSAQGLDVSNYQGRYPWSEAVRVFPGLAFGIHRATQGLGQPGTVSPDPDIEWNHQQIRDNGLRRGAYHFLDPFQSGRAQARYFVDVLGHIGLVDRDMLWCDNETEGPSPAATAACAVDFMDELSTLRPHNPKGAYTFISFSDSGYCAGLGGWPLWLAWPGNSAPAPPPPWRGSHFKFWQWGTRSGIDADAFLGTVADLDAWIASFLPLPPPPPGPPYRHLTKAGDTVGELAATRNTRPDTFLARQAADYQNADFTALASAKLPAGIPYYTDFR